MTYVPILFDHYEPDYAQTCECCGQSPVVTAVDINETTGESKVVYDNGMCGVCTWGTSAALDPDWWNSDED